MPRLRYGVLLVLLGLGAATAPASGETPKHCARWHATGPQGESPHPDPPAFRSLSDNWPLEYLEEALAEGIVVGHPNMPEFALAPNDIGDLLAYIATLKGRCGHSAQLLQASHSR